MVPNVSSESRSYVARALSARARFGGANCVAGTHFQASTRLPEPPERPSGMHSGRPILNVTI
jgi:hypothetical protein